MRRNLLAVVVLTATAVCGSGCFSTTQTSPLQTDIDEIKTQLLLLQKEHATIQEQLDKQAQQVEAALSRDVDTDRVGQADLMARVDSLTTEMEVLGQKLEDSNYRLANISTEISAARSLWEQALTVPPGGSAAPATSAAEAPAPEESSASPASNPARPSAPVASSAPPEEIFNTAYADFTKGNYPLAILGFQEYVERFPDSAFADDALYWVGESYYSQGKYNDAIEAFGEVIRRFPQGDKVPAAHLKRGYAFLELNQTAQGVVQLNGLIEAFPRSDEARLARERLRSLGL